MNVRYATPPVEEVRAAQSTVRTLLMTGAMVAGDHLELGHLADKLNLDIVVLATAVSNLEADGILESIGGETYAVRSITDEEKLEILHLRVGIESRVAERLASTCTPEDLAFLRDEINEQREAATADEKVLFMDHAAEFHYKLAVCAQFPQAAHILRNWQDLQRVIGIQALHDKDSMFRVAREHSELLDRIEAHNPSAAKELVLSHLQQTAHRLNVELDPEPLIA